MIIETLYLKPWLYLKIYPRFDYVKYLTKRINFHKTIASPIFESVLHITTVLSMVLVKLFVRQF